MFISSALLLAFAAPALTPPAGVSLEVREDRSGGVEWFEGTFDEALEAASESNQLVFVYFWSQDSELCGKLQQETFGDADAVRSVNDFICVGANTARTDGYALVQRYHVRTLPSMILVKPDGTVEDAIVGFIEPSGFVDEVSRIKRGEKTVTDFRRLVKEDPKNLETQYQLAVKLYDVGDETGHKEVVDRIRKADPKGKNQVAARLHMEAAREDALENALDDHGEFAHPDAVNLKPVLKLLKKTAHDEVAFEGWLWVAEVEKLSEHPEQARLAAMKAWKHRPEAPVMIRDYGKEMAWRFIKQGEELNKAEKEFALEVSLASMDAFEKVLAGECGCEEGCGCLETDDGGLLTEADWFPEWKSGFISAVAAAYDLNGQAQMALQHAEAALALAPENTEIKERVEGYRARL